MRPLFIRSGAMAIVLVFSHFCKAAEPTPPAIGQTQVTIAWNPSGSPGVVSYNVCWGTSSGVYRWTNNYPATETNAVISGLVAGQVYFVAAQSVSLDGTVSDFSNEARAEINAQTTSSAPSIPLPGSQSNSTVTRFIDSSAGSTNKSTSGNSPGNLASATNFATNVWGIPPFMTMTMAQGKPVLGLAATVGATFAIQATSDLHSSSGWETITNITLTNALVEPQTNTSSPSQNLLNLAFVPAFQEISFPGNSGGRQQYFRAVMPNDYMVLASTVLTNQGYTPRLILVNLPGLGQDVCYVDETGSFIWNSNSVMQVIGAGPKIRQIATTLAGTLGMDWTSASQFTYSNGMGQILATVVETDPPSSDPVPGKNPPGPAIQINF